MTAQIPEKKAIRLHLTNVAGLGAVQLLQSLLPAFEQLSAYQLAEMYLPTRGELAEYHAADSHTKLRYYTRYLPNALSRLLECTLFSGQFNGTTPLLVLGDIPLRCSATQTVFVQTTLLTHGANANSFLDAPKYWIARGLFRLNINHVANFVVQTNTMKAALLASYPNILVPLCSDNQHHESRAACELSEHSGTSSRHHPACAELVAGFTHHTHTTQ